MTEVELFKRPPETAAAVTLRRPGLSSEKGLEAKVPSGAFQSGTPPSAKRRNVLDPSHPPRGLQFPCAQDLDVYLTFQARISSLSSDGTA